MSLETATGERGLWYFDEEKGQLVTYRPERRKQTYQIITDDIHSGLMSPFDGRMYHSKSRLRAEARARGLIEIGNENTEKVAEAKRREREKEDKEATHQALLQAWAQRMGE